MGRYSGNYATYGSVSIPLIPDVSFTDGIIHSIKFSADSIIDTGADISNLPEALVRQYRIPVRDWEDVWWPNGTVQRRPVFLLKVEVPHLRSIMERFMDCGYPEVILGRNLLNRWSIMLDPTHIHSPHDIQIDDS